MIFWIMVGLVSLLVIFTLVPIFRYESWWIRGFDFPRLQIFFFAFLLLISELAFYRSESEYWILIIPTILCMGYHAWWIIPYTFLFKKEVKSTASNQKAENIRIIVANVLMPNRNVQQLLDMVKTNKTDVLVTVETNAWWQEQLNELESSHPYTLKCPMDNLYGMHIYSKFPLQNAAIQFLVEKDIPSMHTLLVLPSGLKVRLHCLHPAPPSPTEHEKSSERDAELIVVAKNIIASQRPVIVTGDLNDVAWSATTRLFRKISGLLDPRIGRGMYNTFHAKYPIFRWPLDHFFHSNHFTVKQLARLPYFGSDHFPMLIELAFQPLTGADQDGITADAEDETWAEEKIAEEGVTKTDVHNPDK